MAHDDEPNKKADTADTANTAKPRKALLGRYITLSAAQAADEDMTAELRYVAKRAKFYNEFADRQEEIQQLVAFHCGLTSPDLVQVPRMFGPNKELVWIHGSFNMCIPVSISRPKSDHTTPPLPTKLGFRVPLPFKIGEEDFPGNAEEKVRSEAATYIWINKNCPDIPIPKLRGFGVAGGLSFCEPRFLPFWQRTKFYLRHFVRYFYGTQEFYAGDHAPQRRRALVNHSYILTDWIEDPDIQMLSDTFSNPHTDTQIDNLYRSISRTMISLARLPQRRIGSWTIDNNGLISLTNRPMFCHLHQLENWSIPSGIPRSMTYTNADSFYLDLLTGHDNRLQFQKNAIYNKLDAQAQGKDLVLMRALLHQFSCQHLRSGPFVMQFTDMHDSNIFVDKDWNIRAIIDLEWACSLPLSNLRPPFWLTRKGIDEFDEVAEYDRFKSCYDRFVDIFEQVEASTSSPLRHGENTYSRTTLMKTALDDGRFWYLSALQTPKGLFNVFRAHIQTMFDEVPKETLREGVSPFWKRGMTSFVNSKLDDYTRYQEEVQDFFNRN
ncbi:hypothetical protein FQN55_000623 [Onygenales sp. PD_40]|nr:hypothetical protein FQN55_000623 [Onygenales sp. PD_40]